MNRQTSFVCVKPINKQSGYTKCAEHYSKFGEPTLSAWSYIGKQINKGDRQ